MLSTLERAVLARVRLAVANGEATERLLAMRADISQPHVNNVLAGKRKPSTWVLSQLAAAIGLTPHDLVALVDGGEVEPVGDPVRIRQFNFMRRHRGMPRG